MKKKCLYLMHINWYWIKQRPQFIAEQLQNCYDLDIVYIFNLKDYSKLVRKSKEKNSLKLLRIIKIPFSSKIKPLKTFEFLINFKKINGLYKNNYDIIWITSPIVLEFLSIIHFKKASIIYDCMDDILAFPQSANQINRLLNLEKYLINKADIIFSSSTLLKQKMHERGANHERVFLINNALSSSFIQDNEFFDIYYYGTVSSWFDTELITTIIEEMPNIRFFIIGPLEIKLPQHERIVYIKAMPHDKLKIFCQKADAFIMPFLVNQLVAAVDPVKIYEYISFNKPVFSIHYSETEKFEEFISLYDTKEHLMILIQEQVNKKRNQIKILYSFLKNNTWEMRIKEISKITNFILKKEEVMNESDSSTRKENSLD
ncbi:hypothetical protein [Paenibacillus sp. YN15]|uniref:hypothetical protein n=1 Tax=Paenibacillus sp. YN15 TaxID=1742774 RepID=UPI000DCF11C5|nr:hypothetical protein [Paenibacillus sp. YN15]RAU93232.1 hypothetical protein DQG13_26275 [Paenibacillus sp. YN15]